MSNPQSAFFVRHPSRIEELMRLHLYDVRKPYVVETAVTLGKTDYENFITDLGVARWFIEANAALCGIDDAGVWHCILVRGRGRGDGVLVMPDGEDYPVWAAYTVYIRIT